MNPNYLKIVNNSLLLLSARVVAKFATILVIFLIARFLGVEGFGILSTLFALTIFAGLVSDFGLVLPTIRDISIQTKDENIIFGKTISARVFWSFISMFGIFAIGTYLKLPVLPIILFSLSSVLEAFSTSLIRSFEGRQEMKTVTLFTVIERLSYSVFVISALLFDPTISSIAVGVTVSYLLMSFFAFSLFRRRFGKIQWNYSWGRFRSYSMIGLPFVITSIFSAVYYKADTIILAMFSNPAEVGYYNASMRIIEAQMFVPMTLMASIFPTISSLYANRDRSLAVAFRKFFYFFLASGLVLSVIMILFANNIIDIFYSIRFRDSIPILRILSLMLLFYFVNFLFSQTLIALKEERLFTRVMIGCALVNIIGNWFIIPRYGYLGAAWVRVIIEVASSFVFYILIMRILRKPAVMKDDMAS